MTVRSASTSAPSSAHKRARPTSLFVSRSGKTTSPSTSRSSPRAASRSSPSVVTGPPPAKRSRTHKRAVDDTSRLVTAAVLAEHATSSTSSYLAIRPASSASLHPGTSSRRIVPTLASLAVSVISEHFDDLFLDGRGQTRRADDGAANARAWLKEYPPKLLNRLLSSLMEQEDFKGSSAPHYASSAQRAPNRRITVSALTELFLRTGQISSFHLPPGFFKAAQAQYDLGNTLQEDPENALLASMTGREGDTERNSRLALKRAATDRARLMDALGYCSHLTYLNLSGQMKLEDETLARLLASLGELEEVIVKGCTEVGDRSVLALANKAGKRQALKVLNLNYTAVTVKGLRGLLARCKSLEVLKLASVNGLTDNNVTILLDAKNYMPEDWTTTPFENLINLKLRGTSVGDTGLAAFLASCPSLQTLDIAYTQVRTLTGLQSKIIDPMSPITPHKLSLSGLKFRLQNTLEKFFKAIASISEVRRRELKTLKLGTLDMSSATLNTITPHLHKFANLDKVSLFGNSTLTSTGVHAPMRRFLSTVGRRCSMLDLSNIKLSSRDFATALLEEDYADDTIASPLRILVLDNTQISDEASAAISTLHELEELHIEQSKITVGGLSEIMQGCPHLRILNLTGCRGIPTLQRRDWFNLYEQGKVGDSD